MQRCQGGRVTTYSFDGCRASIVPVIGFGRRAEPSLLKALPPAGASYNSITSTALASPSPVSRQSLPSRREASPLRLAKRWTRVSFAELPRP